MAYNLIKSLCLFAVLAIALTQTTRPIIGVVTVPSEFPDVYSPDVYSSLHGSAVSFVESGGARVVPIPWDVDDDQLKALLQSVNAVVITGAATQLYTKNIFGVRKTTDYANRLEEILSYAIQYNQAGKYYPVLGVNVGVAALAALIAGELSVIEETGRAYPDGPQTAKVSFTDYKSRSFSFFGSDQITYLQQNNVLGFNNTYGIKASTFNSNANLKSFFEVIATYKESLLDDCVAAAEAINYPIYLLQFDPEAGRRTANSNDLGSNLAVKTTYSLLTNFFAEEARKNSNAFEDSDTEDENLIYQFEAQFMGVKDPRVYFFNSASSIDL